jgi:hypothetical protein
MPEVAAFQRVRDVMTAEPLTVRPDARVGEVLEMRRPAPSSWAW